MAVAFDAVSSVDITSNGATSFTDSTHLTIGATANVLIVPIVWSTASPPTGVSITWNGVALSLISNTSIGNSTHGNVAIYGLLNPATGTQTLAGSWTGTRGFYTVGISFSGADTSSFANAFQNGTTGTGAGSPATISVTATANGATVGVFSTDGSFSAFTSGTQDFLDNTQATVSGAGGHQVGVASSTISVSANNSWSAAGVAIMAPSGVTPTGGGAIYDAGTTFKRTTIYPAFTIPAFIPPATTTWNAWTQWPDRIPTKPWSPDIRPWAFVAPTLPTVFEDYVTFDDFAGRKRPSVVDFVPWVFIEPPPQVWFPSNDRWPDMALPAKRVAQNQDWLYGTFVTPAVAPTMDSWVRWPDQLLPKITLDYQDSEVFFGNSDVVLVPYERWADFASGAKRATIYDFLAFVQVVTAPSAPTLSSWLQWPDFATRAKRAADFPSFTFGSPPSQVWYPSNSWADFAPKVKPLADLEPWSFIPPPTPTTQVWYPTQQWPNFARRKPQYPDSQPSAFVPIIPQTTVSIINTVAIASQTGISSSPVTFTAQPIGTPSSDRLIFVCMQNFSPIDHNMVTAMTIGGVSATELANINDGLPRLESAIWWAPVPTGTTADIVLTLPGSFTLPNAIGIIVYSVTGANTTTPVLASATAADPSAPSASITIPSNGELLAFSTQYESPTSVFSAWTNATVDQNRSYNDTLGNNIGLTTALSSTSGTPTVTATWITPSNTTSLLSMLAIQAGSAPPPQVWYPPNYWDDFARRARSPLNYDPLAFTEVPPSLAMSSWPGWPDFAPRARRTADFPSWAFGFPPSQVWYPPNSWDDFAFKARRPLNFDPLALVQLIPAPPAPTLSSWLQWPDFATRAKPTAFFQPLAFGFPPPQVWFPPNSWDDFARRARSAADFPQPALVQIVTVAPAPTMSSWIQWPDFATRAKPAAFFQPWTFGFPPPQVWYPPVQWPDRVDKKKSPLNYEPSVVVQPIKVPWNEWTTWPDFAPLRAKLWLLAAQQPTLFLYPGTISLPTVNATMLAVAVNSDGAILAINVVPFTNIPPPATFTTNSPASAIVSITETGRLIP